MRKNQILTKPTRPLAIDGRKNVAALLEKMQGIFISRPQPGDCLSHLAQDAPGPRDDYDGPLGRHDSGGMRRRWWCTSSRIV